MAPGTKELVKLDVIVTVNIQRVKQGPELMILQRNIEPLHTCNKLVFCDGCSVTVFSQHPEQVDQTQASGAHERQEHFHRVWLFLLSHLQYMPSSDAYIPRTTEVGSFLEKGV